MESSQRDPKTKQVTKVKPKRIIYFKGHRLQHNSALITQLCRGYKTMPALYKFEVECATRTLMNLYNLHAVRGCMNEQRELVFETSMSGPHHYYGYIEPTRYHIIQFNEKGDPLYFEMPDSYKPPSTKLLPVPEENICQIKDYKWRKGDTISPIDR